MHAYIHVQAKTKINMNPSKDVGTSVVMMQASRRKWIADVHATTSTGEIRRVWLAYLGRLSRR